MLHLQIKRPGEEVGQPGSREHNIDVIGPDFDPAEQRHEQRFDFIRRLACEFLGDLTAAFDQLALLRASERVTGDGIEDCSRIGKKGAKLVDHQPFQISGRDPPAAGAISFCPGDERGRNIIAVAPSLLDRVGWGQTFAGLVEDHACQET
jgi:hypothetical protein